MELPGNHRKIGEFLWEMHNILKQIGSATLIASPAWSVLVLKSLYSRSYPENHYPHKLIRKMLPAVVYGITVTPVQLLKSPACG